MAISSNNKDALLEGILNSKIIRLRYKKADKEFKKPQPLGRTERGEIIIRNIEPYEIKGEYFWGYDTTVGIKNKNIKRFKLDNILNATVLQRKFTKRDWQKDR